MQNNTNSGFTGKKLWEMLFKSNDLPVILQSEAAECGLACLCMISSFHGQRRSLSELRRLFSVSMKGTSLKSIMQMADSLGFTTRPLRLELENLNKLKLPCILHWDMSHFVVLAKVTDKYIEINDPGKGKRKLQFHEVDTSFTGVALELIPNPKFEKKKQVERVKLTDMWSSMNGLSSFLWQLGVLALIVQLLAIITPILNQLIMDDAIVKGDISLLNTIAIGMILLLAIQTTIGLLQNFVGLYLGTQLSFQMKSNLLRHSLRLPISWFEKRHIGDILSRFSSLDPVQSFITDIPVSLALNLIMCIVSMTMMILYSYTLGFIVLGSLLIPLIVRTLFFPIIRRKTDEVISLNAQASTIFMETLRGARSFKLFSKEQERVVQWQNEQIAATNNSVAITKYNLWGNSGLTIITGLQSIAIWFFGAKSVISGFMSLGMLIAFQSYALQFSNAFKGVISILFQWKTLGLHLERLADILHEDAEKGIDEPLNTAKILTGSIEARNISFRYATHEPFIFQNVNLKIEPGEFVAIVGPSGGGKTTLMKNLLGLLPPTEGEIMVDNVSMTGFGIKNFRNQSSAIMQDDRLFQGTICDNVSFFDENLDVNKVEEALKQACIFEEVIKMPMGLETLVGDLGSTLSGGQSQRVLIARALYRRPKILFMDEGTANLDQTSEYNISKNLRDMKITRISVAHREIAIKGADRIILVQNSQVIEITMEDYENILSTTK